MAQNRAALRQEILDFINHDPEVKQVVDDYLALPFVRDDIHRLVEGALLYVLDGECYRWAVENMRNHLTTSIQCHDALVRQKLIPEDCPWGIKLSGASTGVTLYLKNACGREETIFVKSYRDDMYYGGMLSPLFFNELNDYAMYTIIKRCGVKAPPVRLLSAVDACDGKQKQNVYLFVTHITEPRENRRDKTYRFFEMKYKPLEVSLDNRVLVSKECLLPEHIQSVNDAYFKYDVDPVSIARLHLMCRILDLIDLSLSNLGYSLSHQRGTVKTKLCMVDASCDNSGVRNECETLAAFVQHESVYNRELDGLVKTVTEDDYIKAFEKIEKNFIPACDEMLNQVKAMTFESEEDQRQFSDMVASWKANFQHARSLVAAAVNSHTACNPFQ